jgi:hypothetical protein
MVPRYGLLACGINPRISATNNPFDKNILFSAETVKAFFILKEHKIILLSFILGGIEQMEGSVGLGWLGLIFVPIGRT